MKKKKKLNNKSS